MKSLLFLFWFDAFKKAENITTSKLKKTYLCIDLKIINVNIVDYNYKLFIIDNEKLLNKFNNKSYNLIIIY